MVAFARATTKSWLSKLWPGSAQLNKCESADFKDPQELAEKHNEQNKRFLELTKNGGIWFS